MALKQHMHACNAPPEAFSAVELTIALHRVFHTPYEVLLFEREALALPHRLLTGQQLGFLPPSQANALPQLHAFFEKSHGPMALAHALQLVKERKLSKHPGKVVVVLEERRPVYKESFEVLSQAGAANLPWVLLLARTNMATATEAFLPRHALAAFWGSLGFMLWPTLEGTHMEKLEEVLRQAKAAHKAVVLHLKL